MGHTWDRGTRAARSAASPASKAAHWAIPIFMRRRWTSRATNAGAAWKIRTAKILPGVTTRRGDGPWAAAGLYRRRDCQTLCRLQRRQRSAKEKARTDPQVSPREVENILLPPFKAAIKEAGLLGVMSSYNDYDSIPVTGSSYWLTERLRKDFGFRGYVVSDSAAVGISLQETWRGCRHEGRRATVD